MVINGTALELAPETSRRPHGLVLDPLLFFIYVNDIGDGIISKISKFANNTKLSANAAVGLIMQRMQVLHRLGDRPHNWQISFYAISRSADRFALLVH